MQRFPRYGWHDRPASPSFVLADEGVRSGRWDDAPRHEQNPRSWWSDFRPFYVVNL